VFWGGGCVGRSLIGRRLIIPNPGQAAIEAALNPEESEYIFFVADGTGGHAFAKTLREHNLNVAAWRKIERERAAAQGN